MQNRTVIKLFVEVNMLNTFANKPKPKDLDVRELAREIDGIHHRLVSLNNKLAQAYATKS